MRTKLGVVDREERWARSWMRAGVASALILALLFLIFAFVPDRLAQLVERRSGSTALRDLILAGWLGASLVAASWVLVTLQKRRII